MANFTVIYDACIFYPAPLRDLRVRLAQTRRFRARWTEAIITLNLQDFPSTALGEYEILAIHPDDFILDLADLEPQVLERVAKAQRQALQRPPLDPEAFVAVLRRQELPGVADFLNARLDLI